MSSRKKDSNASAPVDKPLPPPNQSPDTPGSLLGWIRRNGPVIVLLVGNGLVLSIARYYADSFVGERIDATLKPVSVGADEMRRDLAEIKGSLETLKQFLAPLIAARIRAIADLPQNDVLKVLPQVAATVKLAQRESVRAPEEIVERLGNRLLGAVPVEAEATGLPWQTVGAVLNYQSHGRPKPQAVESTEPLPGNLRFSYEMRAVRGKPPPGLRYTKSRASADNAAQWNKIGEDYNSNLPFGPAFLLANGGAVTLDGMHLRNVVLENVEVHYSGQPLVLKNVYFVNCTFVLQNTGATRNLARQVLAGPAVDFEKAA